MDPSNTPQISIQEEYDEADADIYHMIRVMTWMMEGFKERLRVELRAYVRELFLQARIEDLLKQKKP